MAENVAVIGCGYWGRNLVRNFARLGALRTVCDADAEALKRVSADYPGVKTESDYSRVLADDEIKGVVIATPAVLHHSMAKQALNAGRDVFVEKPLALKVSEGRELVELAEQRGQVLLVGHVLEYHPAVARLKEMIDRGELGKIQYIYSNRLNLGKLRTEENVLWSFAPHDISVILLLLGGELPTGASAYGGYYLHRDIADITLTTLSFRHGVKAHIFVSWLHPFKEQRLVVIGDKAMAEFNDTSQQDKLLLSRHQIEWVQQKPVPHRQEAEPVPVSDEEPLALECQDFLECMRSRTKPRVDGTKGLKVLEILSACQQSLEEDGRVIPLGREETGFYVHQSSVVEEPFEIGEGTKIWHFSHVMPGVKIGKDCVIGQNVFIGRGVKIGSNVKLENNVSVFDGVTLEDDVFCGPSCVFTNVINPRSQVSRKDEFKPTLVKQGASIGANATIVCGHSIGRYALIGAGAVVTHDIPDYALAYGNPARVQGWACRCGVTLKFDTGDEARCTGCGRSYRRKDGQVIALE